MADTPELTVVIPVLNEAAAIGLALQRVRAQLPQAELIVVDGGSTDGTAALAAEHARVVLSPPGRAQQLNTGALAGSGERLLFLHVDTTLPDDAAAVLERLIAQGCRAGAFPLRIAGRHPLLPLLAWGANLRTRLRHVALGDQALFCARQVFEELGGFPDLPILEDYAFTLRLRRAGIRLCVARSPVVTSGRRWDQRGFWRTWWQFRRIYWRFHRSADLRQLRAEYEDVR